MERKTTHSEQGFVHPGIGCTVETLEVMCDAVRDGAYPWAAYYEGLQHTTYLAEGTAPQCVAQICNDQDIADFAHDAQMCWANAVDYVVTGKEARAAKAAEIVQWYADRTDFFPRYFTDCHIKLGKYVFTLCDAVEILRAAVGEPVEQLVERCIRPIVDGCLNHNGYFMNQHSYAVMGALAYAVLADDRAAYEKYVEWTTVNASLDNQGRNGSIAGQIRLIDGHVQLAEMGRDQAHAGGNLTNLIQMAQLCAFQKTTVDPVHGTVCADGVPVLSFMDNRLLAGLDAFCAYNIGRDIPWSPLAAESSQALHVLYHTVAVEYRGRLAENKLHHVYRSAGYDLSAHRDVLEFMEASEARNITEIRSGKTMETLHNYFFGFWIGLTRKAETAPPAMLETREGVLPFSAAFLQEEGAWTLWGMAVGGIKQLGLYVKCRGEMRIDVRTDRHAPILQTLWIPDTHDAWRYVVIDLRHTSISERGAGSLLRLELSGDGTLECDHVNSNAEEIRPIEPYEFTSLYGAVGVRLSDAILDVTPAQCGTEELRLVRDNGVSLRTDVLSITTFATEAEAMAQMQLDDAYERASRRAVEAAKGEGLMAMKRAYDRRRLLNPRLADGSLDYPKCCESTIGVSLQLCADGDARWGTGLSGDKTLTLDFGTAFSLRVQAIAVQSRTSFPDRVNGMHAYGSNDGVAWTRLTRTPATVSEELQTLEILEEQQQIEYRYIRLQMPSGEGYFFLFDLGELRIFGERNEKGTAQ